MTTVDVGLGQRGYSISISPGLIKQLPTLLARHHERRQLALVADDTVMKLYGQSLAAGLTAAGFSPIAAAFPPGEAGKNIETYHGIITDLLSGGLRRDGLILALGGGVTGDLAGFVAASLHRGMDFVQIPTTLLAQVDSSVGGKTGINHASGKNLIGAFHQPQAVYIDPETLTTLPQRELDAGLGEVAKYALLDSRLFDWLSQRLDDLRSFEDTGALGRLIAQCCAIKADVVASDEKEQGRRRVLNLGHTLGHALEACTQYRYFRHGEAVLYGLEWAVFVSRRQNRLSEANARRLLDFLAVFERPPLPPGITPRALTEAMELDKKQTRMGLKWIMLDDIGQPVVETARDVLKVTAEWLDALQRR